MENKMESSLPLHPRTLLALESSTILGGAALLEDGVVVDEITLDAGLRHGRDLMPAAAELLRRRNLKPGDVTAVGVSFGPGSYTGIRIGVMAAKAFAYAAECRLLAVSSLAALAETFSASNACRPGTRIAVLQDARRDEVYAGLYRVDPDGVTPLTADAAVAPEEAARMYAELSRTAEGCLAAGTGFVTYAQLFGALGNDPGGALHPRAGATARLGWRHFLREDFTDPLVLQPLYLRRDAGADWSRDVLIS